MRQNNEKFFIILNFIQTAISDIFYTEINTPLSLNKQFVKLHTGGKMKNNLLILLSILFFSANLAFAQTPTFVGDSRCMLCHNNVNSKLGYNIYAEYQKTGHPYKLTEIKSGVPVVFPANTAPAVIAPPGKTLNDFVYTIGGYIWKTRFVQPDGWVYTGTNVQYNIREIDPAKRWVAYNATTPTKYDFACFQCHTTGASTEGSWVTGQTGFGTFAYPGVRCEGCHGAGSAHAADFTTKTLNQGNALRVDRCADCHRREVKTSNAIPVSSSWLSHRQQIHELRSSKHGDGKGATDLTCSSCHDPHLTIVYPNVAAAGKSGIETKCEGCHGAKTITINGKAKTTPCIDCHMSFPVRNAIGVAVGNGWKGDERIHVMGINTNPVTRTAFFNTAGTYVQLDANGLANVTLDYACLPCHSTKDVAWASLYAKDMHKRNIIVSVEEKTILPTEYALEQNYPNPFNPSTTISFSLPKASQVNLEIYSITGELIFTIINNMMPSGNHNVKLDMPQELSSGVYIYRIAAGDFVSSKKMMYMK